MDNARSAHEDRLQARNALLPSISDSTQFLGTQGNGKTPEGRFVTNDGVHVYREWAVIHEDLSPSNYMLTGYRRAAAAEAIAKAKTEIAQRGLNVTVTKNYYALLVAQRNMRPRSKRCDQAKRFSRHHAGDGEARAGAAQRRDQIANSIRTAGAGFRGSETSHGECAAGSCRAAFPTLNENFTVVDDLDSPQALPPFPEVQGMAEHENPDLRVAAETMREAELDVSPRRALSFLRYRSKPITASRRMILRCTPSRKLIPTLGPLPTLGYFVTASLTVPVWDWGTLRSKLHQAEYKQEQARAELSQAQRQMLGNLYSSYNEAAVARVRRGQIAPQPPIWPPRACA